MRLFFGLLALIATWSTTSSAASTLACEEVFKVQTETENTSALTYEDINARVEVLRREIAEPLGSAFDVRSYGKGIQLYFIDFSRITPLRLQGPVETLPPSFSTRDQHFSNWKSQTLPIKIVQIEKLSDIPLVTAYSFSEGMKYNDRVAQVQGQVAMAGNKLPVDALGRPMWTEELRVLWHLHEAGIIHELAVGRWQNNDYRIITDLSMEFNTKVLDFIDVDEATMIDIDRQLAVLETLPIPTLHMSYNVRLNPGEYNYMETDFFRLRRGPEGKYFISLVPEMEKFDFHSVEGDVRIEGVPSKPGDLFSLINIVRFIYFNQSTYPDSFIRQLEVRQEYEKIFQLLYFDRLVTADYYRRENNFPESLLGEDNIKIDGEAGIAVTEWQTPKSLKDHYKYHGAKEMKVTPDKYEQLSKEFFQDEKGPSILIRRQNSRSWMKYNFVTHEFGILNEKNQIVTYYILDGKKRPVDENFRYLGENIFR